MESRNKMMKIALYSLSISALILIGLAIFQHQQINKLSQGSKQGMSVNNQSTDSEVSIPSEAVQKGIKESTALAGKPKEPNKDEINDLSYQLEAAEEEVDMANKQLSDEQARKAEIKKKEIELQKKYMQDPTYRNVARKSLDTIYDSLFKALNLSPEKLEMLKDIMIDQQTASTNLYMESQTVTPSEEKRTEFEQRNKEIDEEYTKNLKELLGDNDYEKFQLYRERSIMRLYVNNFMVLLGSEEKLTEAKQEDLIVEMHEKYTNIASQRKNEESKFLFPSERYEEKEIARSLNNTARMNEAFVEAAQNILTPSQTEQFKTYLKQQSDRSESSMKLQALKYGTQNTQKSDDDKSE